MIVWLKGALANPVVAGGVGVVVGVLGCLSVQKASASVSKYKADTKAKADKEAAEKAEKAEPKAEQKAA